jgi:membrane protein
MILISKFTVQPGWTVVFQRTCREIYLGQCFQWAAALAFYSFLALFPALLVVVSVASLLPFQRSIDQVVDLVGRFAPGDVVAIVRDQLLQITDRPHGRLLALSLVGTIWSMSSGMAALIGTLNQAQHITEGRSWWRVRATAIALTAALALFMVLSFTLAMVGPSAAEQVAGRLGLGAVFTMAWQIVRWPAAFAIAVAAVGTVYHFAPDIKSEFAWITPGSISATALWLAVSLGFKWYVFHFGNYQKTYGAIGGVMVLLLWFYFSGLAILLGAQLNATIDRASRDARAEATDRLHPPDAIPGGTDLALKASDAG